MKHVLSVIAVALALATGSTALARDGDGRRYDRGHSYRQDYRGHRDGRHFDRRHFGDRKFYGDRKFDRRYNDRKFDRRYYDRKFYDGKFYDRRFDDRRYYRDRRFDRRFDDRKFYGDRFFYRSWRRGDRLPSVFLSTRFVINDFGSYKLYRPPRGYRWVRVERDAFLVGVATGVVLAVAADRFY